MTHRRVRIGLALAVALVVLGSIEGGRRTPAGLVMRTVTPGQLNLLNQTILDQQAGRAIVLTSPQGPDPHCRVLVLDTHTGCDHD